MPANPNQSFRLMVAFLLLGSGFCALVYQTVWFREFRLVFGCSTAATAAVTAVFMGGLGLGGLFFGKRADTASSPLKLYACLELGVSVLAGFSPFLIDLSRHAYIHICASASPGFPAKMLLRLILAILIMGPPAFLMGGTFPAAVRAAIRPTDINRGPVAVLYGSNTIGAVLGVFAATFFFFEWCGFRHTLGYAVLLNALIAFLAFRLSSRGPSDTGKNPVSGTVEPPTIEPSTAAVSPLLVSLSAFLSGFCFFLLEMVWFRLIGPLMGGTTYSYGSILVIALLGIGTGGLLFQFHSRSRPATPSAFAFSCCLQGFLTAATFALGDWPAILTLFMKYFSVMGFWGLVLSWSVIGFIIVFPVAIVAGYQFPLLISLLGQGDHEVGKQIGRTYAWNTAGSILGSLLGGFALLPGLTATGCWRLAAMILSGLGLTWCVAARPRPGHPGNPLRLVVPLGLGGAAMLLMLQPGPTAFTRHSAVGYGSLNLPRSWNQLQETISYFCRNVREEFEGVESVIGLDGSDGWNFIVNGKSDGNGLRDGEMQVMAGLVSAVFHPGPRRAFVVGLGTGCTSGALAQIPTMELVKTAEIEPRILEVAKRCSPVNFSVLENPKAQTVFDDAREVLLCASETYDLIVSEPSNPHRAGISSLFTREFYEVVLNRLAPDGIFTQWVQAYAIDSETFSGIYATLFTVFPHIETWETRFGGDVLLLCSRHPIRWDADHIRRRISQEPFRSALASTWKSYDLEGFLAKFALDSAGGWRIAQMARQAGNINRDDWLPVEYGFARSIGLLDRQLVDLRRTAVQLGNDTPPLPPASFDPRKLEESRLLLFSLYGFKYPVSGQTSADTIVSVEAQDLWGSRAFAAAHEKWCQRAKEPTHPIEILMWAETAAAMGDERVSALLTKIPADRDVEKDLILARFFRQKGDLPAASLHLRKAFTTHRTNPWPLRALVARGLDLALMLAEADKSLVGELCEALNEPFCQNALQEKRLTTLILLSRHLPPATLFRHLQQLEPYPIWQEEFLAIRNACYRSVSPAWEAKSFADLSRFYDAFFPSLSRLVMTSSPD
jgi:predicted membrane-bound spermidine synthase